MLCTLLPPYTPMQNMLQMNLGQSRLMTSFRKSTSALFLMFCSFLYFILVVIETEACPIPVMQIVLMLTGQDTSQADQP